MTGGNGRGGPWAEAKSNTYVFSVQPGQTDLDVSVALANDPNDELIGYLVDPNGQTVGYSSNVTTNSSFSQISARFVTLYHVAPARAMEPGPALPQPGGGSELREPFTGAIRFNQVRVSGNLPQHAALASGQTYTYTVTVDNTG